jgi:hypothetical protein
MAQRARLKSPSLPLVAVLLAIGGITVGLGVLSFKDLSQIYREEDLVYGETPSTFRFWFLNARQERKPDYALVEGVAHRLTGMRVEQRRALVRALMSDNFLASFSNNGRNSRSINRILLNGFIEALGSSPLSGDLWLGAARLERRLNGYDEAAQHYLEASLRYAPREVNLAADRLLFMISVAPLLTNQLKEAVSRDYQLVRREGHPSLAARAEPGLRQSRLIADELPAAVGP